MRHSMYHNGMKIKLLILTTILYGCSPAPIEASEKTLAEINPGKPAIVVVIDTGFKSNPYTKNAKLCKYGHKNFTNVTEVDSTQSTVNYVPIDNHGHGTNVAGLIQKYAGNANYCMVIVKYYDPKDTGFSNLNNTVRAINYATNIKAKYINYSGGGTDLSYEERTAVKRFLDKGGKFIAAAGNERKDLKDQGYYPAMDDDRVIRVGSMSNGKIAPYSNFGKHVTRWEDGTNQIGFGIIQSGTSQATAIATGKIIKEECDK